MTPSSYETAMKHARAVWDARDLQYETAAPVAKWTPRGVRNSSKTRKLFGCLDAVVMARPMLFLVVYSMGRGGLELAQAQNSLLGMTREGNRPGCRIETWGWVRGSYFIVHRWDDLVRWTPAERICSPLIGGGKSAAAKP